MPIPSIDKNIDKQLHQLEEKLKPLPKGMGFGRIIRKIEAGFEKMVRIITTLGKDTRTREEVYLDQLNKLCEKFKDSMGELSQQYYKFETEKTDDVTKEYLKKIKKNLGNDYIKFFEDVNKRLKTMNNIWSDIYKKVGKKVEQNAVNETNTEIMSLINSCRQEINHFKKEKKKLENTEKPVESSVEREAVAVEPEPVEEKPAEVRVEQKLVEEGGAGSVVVEPELVEEKPAEVHVEQEHVKQTMSTSKRTVPIGKPKTREEVKMQEDRLVKIAIRDNFKIIRNDLLKYDKSITDSQRREWNENLEKLNKLISDINPEDTNQSSDEYMKNYRELVKGIYKSIGKNVPQSLFKFYD